MDRNAVYRELSAEQRNEYRAWRDGFESPFWRMLVEYMQTAGRGALEAQFSAKSWDDVIKNRAKLEVLNLVINMEHQIDSYFADEAGVDVGEE